MKIGIAKSATARRSIVDVSVPQSMSMRPWRSMSKRLAAVTGTHSSSSPDSFNAAFTASATRWHSATEKPACGAPAAA